LLASAQMHAGGVGGNVPWEAPLTKIATSLTGPVAYAIGLIGLALAGGTLIFGGDLSEWGRRGAHAGLAISVLVLATPIMSSLFGVGGALV
jgi:type IV secretion system protein TrbC